MNLWALECNFVKSYIWVGKPSVNQIAKVMRNKHDILTCSKKDYSDIFNGDGWYCFAEETYFTLEKMDQTIDYGQGEK